MTWLLVIVGALFGPVLVFAGPLPQLLGPEFVLALLLGGFAGLAGGLLLAQSRRIRRLEAMLEEPLQPSAGTTQSESESESEWWGAPAARAADSAAGAGTGSPDYAGSDTSTHAPGAPTDGPEFEPEARQPRAGARPRVPPPRSPVDDRLAAFFATLRGWLFGGNLPVRIGVLASLVGVAALLRYAAEQGWLSLPIEWRLMGIAVSALAALAFAWRQRKRRRGFALALQGGAVGVLVMTVFAAFALYQLIPAPLAFGLLVVLVGATALLAVAQHSQVLAVLGLIAAFAAPILVSRGGGSAAALFGYYFVVNAAVFALAWRQHWPLLDRLGLVFTFIIATLWGVLEYRPALYPAAQPYLALFFLFYTAIPLIKAISGRDGGRLDVLLVFGLPLIVFPLQFALVDGRALPVAFSALAIALVNAASGVLARARAPRHPLWPAQAALALGFATLAVPFALSGPVIALVWAVEGAALVWLGILQQRRRARLSGLALQGVSGLAWLATLNEAGGDPIAVFNPPVLGALALSLAAFFSTRLLARAHASAALLNTLAVWALGWWLVAGAFEILQQFEHQRPWANASIAFLGLTAYLTARAYALLRLSVPALAVLLALASGLLFGVLDIDGRAYLLAGWGGPAWIAFLFGAWAAERTLIAAPAALRGALAVLVHLAWIVVISNTLLYFSADVLALGSGWQWLARASAPLAMLAWIVFRRAPPLTPGGLPERPSLALERVLVGVVMAGVMISLASSGEPSPLVFIPLLNPLELAQWTALLLVLGTTGLRARGHRKTIRSLPGLLGLLLGWLMLSAMWLRLAHHGLAVEWSVSAMAGSNTAQAGLSVLWTVLAVVFWVSGSRRASRALWWVGAGLLGVVLVKLLLVDRQFLSTLAGIVSFLAFGGLCIVIGFLAPAPPPGAPENEPEAGPESGEHGQVDRHGNRKGEST